MVLTSRVLREIMPHCPSMDLWADVLWTTIRLSEAISVPRAAALLATVAHECGECRWLVEKSGAAYEGRKTLGNTEKGDGQKYRGRGLIHLTGRSNYDHYGRIIGVNLTLYPEEAAAPLIAGQVTAAYWKEHSCNELADRFQFKDITRRINGGLNGLALRQSYYLRALEALGKEV